MDKQDKLIDFETLCEGHITSMGRSKCPYHGKISRCLHPDNKAIDGWHAPSIRIEECPIWQSLEVPHAQNAWLKLDAILFDMDVYIDSVMGEDDRRKMHRRIKEARDAIRGERSGEDG